MPIAKQVYRSHIFEGRIIGGANVINKNPIRVDECSLSGAVSSAAHR